MALRITGGNLRGRHIHVPDRALRPTQDCVRAAIFSSLAEVIPSARVVDLFAGSGAIGIEAFSRGAAYVCLVEQNRKVFSVLKRNIRDVCKEKHIDKTASADEFLSPKIQLISDDVMHFLRHSQKVKPCDIIFADPPYNQEGCWLKRILPVLAEESILKQKGLFVMEQDVHASFQHSAKWFLLKRRIYGDTQICIFRKNNIYKKVK